MPNDAIVLPVVLAIITALGVIVAPTLAVLVTHRTTKRKLLDQDESLQQIHVLVNSRLTEALTEIAILKKALKIERSEPT